MCLRQVFVLDVFILQPLLVITSDFFIFISIDVDSSIFIFYFDITSFTCIMNNQQLKRELMNLEIPEETPLKGLQVAIKQAGSQAALARSLGVSPQAVQQWVADSKLPIGRAVEISSLYCISLMDLIDIDTFNAILSITE